MSHFHRTALAHRGTGVRAAAGALALTVAAIAADGRAQEAPINPLPQTAGELVGDLAVCAEAEIERTDVANYRACYAQIWGVLAGAQAISQLAGSANPFCLPAGLTDRELIDDFRAFVARNDDIRQWPPASAVITAVLTNYPCDEPMPEGGGADDGGTTP